mmetsp:Transcript_83370/g.144892  ORF Transcript_83370/g.144892 Transcript_83370/m.144892 type:complete len:513 (+) Transcript_83370:69-1607(+)
MAANESGRVRNLRKKLAQIATLEERAESEGLSEEQLEKLGRKAQFEAELQELLEPPPPAYEEAPPVETTAEQTPDEVEASETVEQPAEVQAEEQADTDLAVEEMHAEKEPTGQMEGQKEEVEGEAAVEEVVQTDEQELADEAQDTEAVDGAERQDAVAVPAPAAVAMPPAEPQASADGDPARTDKAVRGIRKKLAQIAALEEKQAQGEELSQEQLEKMERKAQLEEELQELLQPEELEPAEPPPPPAEPQRKAPKPKAPQPKAPQPPAKLVLPTNAVRDVKLDCDKSSVPLSPTLAMLRSPSQRWQDDPVSVEDIIPTPKAEKAPQVEIIEGVQPFGSATQASQRMKDLVKEVSALSMDAFEEDCLEMVTRKSRWKMTLIARPEGSPLELDNFMLDDYGGYLIGFIVYRLRPELESFSIAKLAIVPEYRRQGHGCRLIEWCIKTAKKQPNIAFISLSSLPEAVKFYQRIGFRAVDVKLDGSSQCGPDEDLVEGQVYMEYRLKGRSGGRKKKR